MKKKIIRILVCILFFGANVFPCISGIKNIEVKKVNNFPKFFSDGFEWAISAGGSYIDKGLDISLDSNGNIYVTGEFHNTVTFGNYTITSNGNYDVFVAKADNDGNWLWAKNGGGSGWDEGACISVDSSGNVFIGGYFHTTAYFGNLTLICSGNYDIFVVKLDTNGNWIWAKRAGGTDNDKAEDIEVDSLGNCYLIGWFWSSADFGSFILSDLNYNPFIAKLDTNGNWLWAIQGYGSGSNQFEGSCIDSSGNIYVTGCFEDTATYGSYVLTSYAWQINDIMIAKVNSNGNWLWAKSATGDGHDGGYDIYVGNSGNIYVTGVFNLWTTFGSTTIYTNGGADVFVAKADNNGNWLWAQGYGGSSNDAVRGVCVDSNENVYTAGEKFGKLDSSGNWIWLFGNGAIANSLNIYPGDNLFYVGHFSGTVHFNHTTLISNGVEDLFIAKLIHNYNNPPNTPSDPNPINGANHVSINTDLSWTCSDPDGDPLTYDVYFGTNSNPPIVQSNWSSTSYDQGIMSCGITYFWKIIAWDDQSSSTSGPIWSFTTKINQPPNPPTITGPHYGKINTEYTYIFGPFTEPDGDSIYCYCDWGDGTPSDWFGPYSSGETVNASHMWTEPGTYSIQVKLRDINGLESDWSEPFSIEIIQLNTAFFLGIFQNINQTDDLIIMKALLFIIYPSDSILYQERNIILSKDYLGYLGTSFIIAVGDITVQ